MLTLSSKYKLTLIALITSLVYFFDWSTSGRFSFLRSAAKTKLKPIIKYFEQKLKQPNSGKYFKVVTKSINDMNVQLHTGNI